MIDSKKFLSPEQEDAELIDEICEQANGSELVSKAMEVESILATIGIYIPIDPYKLHTLEVILRRGCIAESVKMNLGEPNIYEDAKRVYLKVVTILNK